MVKRVNSLRSRLRIDHPTYIQGTALLATWELTNVSNVPVYLFRDWFEIARFRELPKCPLSGFSVEILRSNGEPLPDFVEVSGATGDPVPLRLHHLYRLNQGEAYEVTIDVFHFTVCDPDTPLLWKTHYFHLLNPQRGEVLQIRIHYTNNITSPSLDLDIWTGRIDSNIVEVRVLDGKGQ